MGHRVDLKDMVGIRVRDVVRVRLTLHVMRLPSMLRPDAPHPDHLDRAAELRLHVLERDGEVYGVHDLGDRE